jgi:hypothetical protein
MVAMPPAAIATAAAAIGRVRMSVDQVSEAGRRSPIRSLISSFPVRLSGA